MRGRGANGDRFGKAAMLGSGKTTRRFSAKTLVFSDEVPIATPPSARGGGKGIETDDGGGNIKQHNGHGAGGGETTEGTAKAFAHSLYHTLSPFCTHSARLWHSSFTVLSQHLFYFHVLPPLSTFAAKIDRFPHCLPPSGQFIIDWPRPPLGRHTN
ncbi:hypothetical protein niasHT_007375 [Heterodera trifolii]|uniref:Uncharacterized protein n=1 Tax=Heterodera trifolii TaxID=157864 RepID=A0ABD2LLF8_9BILA